MTQAVPIKQTVRQIAQAVAFSALGLLVAFLIKTQLDVDLSKIAIGAIGFAVSAFGAVVMLPRVFGTPFGRVTFREFARGIGFTMPEQGWKHVLLGALLGACTLAGMLVGSVLAGAYVVDTGNITVGQAVFSLNPAVWEEVYFRGVIMIVLLRATGSVRKAFVGQCVLFALVHIKGADLLAFVDAFSVLLIAVGFTYTAYRTRSLLAGIVFHFVHNTLLFFVQAPDGTAYGAGQHALFYGCLWIGVAVGCWISHVASERFGVRAAAPLYRVADGAALSQNPFPDTLPHSGGRP